MLKRWLSLLLLALLLGATGLVAQAATPRLAFSAGDYVCNIPPASLPAGTFSRDMSAGEVDNISPNASRFLALLTGDDEVPPVVTDERARAQLFTDDTSFIQLRMRMFDMTPTTFSHIHCAPVGVDGPVGVTLFAGTFSGTGTFTTTIVEPDAGNTCGWSTIADIVADMLAGNAYINIHTEANPGGAIRGQVQLVP